METSSKTVLCPHYRASRRHFTVRFCDNLVSGVPACVVDNFYPDWDHEELVARMLADVPDAEICRHFVRTDVWYDASVKKSGCFYGGSCAYPAVQRFDACSVDCPRFKEGVKA